MKYKLDNENKNKNSVWGGLQKLVPLLSDEKAKVYIVAAAILFNTGATLLGPIIISHAIDTNVLNHDTKGLILSSIFLFFVYCLGLIGNYGQTRIMGGVARRILFKLRNALFQKLLELPISFFNQNKSGDLISRINNDTDKLNQFFAQALMQFLGSFFLIVGSGIFLLYLNIRLGILVLLPAIFVLCISQLLASFLQQKNKENLQSLGNLSSEVQESIANFKVLVAFNRLDYFRSSFKNANERNYKASVTAGVANGTFTPLYTFASSIAQMLTLGFGIYFISTGSISIGLLIGYFLYVNNFYSPLRQLASVWSSLELALAALERISEVLDLESDMPITQSTGKGPGTALSFGHVSFAYPDGKEVLHDISLELHRGKTYALVGPTGGGKTTTASLMARLYDPTSGTIYLDGIDIRSLEAHERTQKIGFILQEPFLFTGTIRDNILYGNSILQSLSDEELTEKFTSENLSHLFEKFPDGLQTKVSATADSLSLGQKQLLAFMRAYLRKPEIVILDEATANIDTVTERELQSILEKMPATTTKVIIAHRLNTIASADEIFFVNGGTVEPAGNLDNAVKMLLSGKRSS